MSATGYIQARAYAGRAQIPLEGVALMVTRPDGTAISMALTDRSGLIMPIAIPVPDAASSQEPDSGIVPYTNVNLYARLESYEQIAAEDIQIFPDTVTYQQLEMIPLAEHPTQWTKGEIFKTPPQNL